MSPEKGGKGFGGAFVGQVDDAKARLLKDQHCAHEGGDAAARVGPLHFPLMPLCVVAKLIKGLKGVAPHLQTQLHLVKTSYRNEVVRVKRHLLGLDRCGKVILGLPDNFIAVRF